MGLRPGPAPYVGPSPARAGHTAGDHLRGVAAGASAARRVRVSWTPGGLLTPVHVDPEQRHRAGHQPG